MLDIHQGQGIKIPPTINNAILSTPFFSHEQEI